MYRSFYQLSQKPFQISTDPGFLWLGENHKEALANLVYGLREGNGFVVLTGEVGTGKTTLVNALLATLPQDVLVANITHPALDPVDLLHLVVRTLAPTAAATGKVDLMLYFQDFLRRQHAQNKRVLLVIDEAHRLPPVLLEEIRLWSNLEEAGRRLINIFFVGQSELKSTLQSRACSALRQRITLYHHLQPLSEPQVAEYVVHRLGVAGVQRPLFTPEAIKAVYKATEGYPRRINILCDRALLTGFVKALAVVDARTVLECAREIGVLAPRTPIRTALQTAGAQIHQALATGSGNVWRRLRKSWAQIHWPARRPNQGTRSENPGITQLVLDGGRRIFASRLQALFSTGLFAIVVVTLALWSNGRSNPADSAMTLPTPALGEPDGPAPAMPRPDQGAALSEASSFGEAAADGQAEPPATHAASVSAAGRQRPPQGAERSPLALAEEALARQDFQAALALLEADGGRIVSDNAAGRTLYARALTGRAGTIADQSPDEAIQLVSKALATDPDLTEAYVLWGALLTRSKSYGEAIEAYGQAAARQPERPDVLFNLGYLYAAMGQLDDAQKMLQRVVDLAPVYLDKALFNLAVVLHRQGRTRESIEALERALALQPENDKVRSYLRQLRGVSR